MNEGQAKHDTITLECHVPIQAPQRESQTLGSLAFWPGPYQGSFLVVSVPMEVEGLRTRRLHSIRLTFVFKRAVCIALAGVSTGSWQTQGSKLIETAFAPGSTVRNRIESFKVV